MMILCCYTEENVYSALNFRHIKRTTLWFQVPVWKSDKLQAYRIENREDGCKIAPSNNCPNFITPLRTLHLIVIVILTKSPPPFHFQVIFLSVLVCLCILPSGTGHWWGWWTGGTIWSAAPLERWNLRPSWSTRHRLSWCPKGCLSTGRRTWASMSK